MKVLLIALVLGATSVASANSCLKLVGEYIDCTTGEVEADELLEVPKSLKIANVDGAFKITEDSEEVTWRIGEVLTSEVELEGSKITMSTTPSCKNSSLKLTNIVDKVEGADPMEAEFIKDLIESSPITYSLKADTLVVKGLLDIEYSCKRK